MLGYKNIRTICQCETPKGASNGVRGKHNVIVCMTCGLVVPREKLSLAWRISQFLEKEKNDSPT